jgi:hypothetical protein
MENIIFRTLRADEIEVRPSHIKDGKANLLLYIDSRAVVSLLNETVGNLNWQSKFYEAKGQLIGEIGIYDKEKEMWIWKGDTGSESNIEAQKGLISDVYKRVLARWGIDELYSSPRIQVPDDGYGNSGYKVAEIRYNENRNIIHLVIVNRLDKEVFRWGVHQQSQSISPQTPILLPDRKGGIGNSTNEVIQSIKDNANKVYQLESTNREELKRFVNFYVAKIEREGWKGTFNFDILFERWMDRLKC